MDINLYTQNENNEKDKNINSKRYYRNFNTTELFNLINEYKQTFKNSLKIINELNFANKYLNFSLNQNLGIMNNINISTQMNFFQLIFLSSQINSQMISKGNYMMTQIDYLIEKIQNNSSNVNSTKNTTNSFHLDTEKRSEKFSKFVIEKNESVVIENKTQIINFDYDRKIGKYDIRLRLKKILKFKLKLYRRRNEQPVQRSFSGRSKIAINKVRFRGRFVKQPKRIFSVVNSNHKEGI